MNEDVSEALFYFFCGWVMLASEELQESKADKRLSANGTEVNTKLIQAGDRGWWGETYRRVLVCLSFSCCPRSGSFE